MTDLKNRRPLAVREWAIIKSMAGWLSRRDVTPNQISLASAVFAAVAGISLWAIPRIDLPVTLLCVVALSGIIGRALCNIFDGMVAIEGGKTTKSGELFNDIPDRFSDAFIFVGAGYACTPIMYGVELGWCAALLSVMTAYIRYVGRALGAPSDFRGPMAKTHRMALISFAILMTPFESVAGNHAMVLFFALLIINIGCLITCARRAKSAYDFIERT